MCFPKDAERLKGIAEALNAELVEFPKDWRRLLGYDVIVARVAAGIAVRKIAPLLASKYDCPAIVVLDPKLRFAVPLLGGHAGGNDVAVRLSKFGITPVITTSAEFSDGFAVGVGYRKGVKAEEIANAVRLALREAGIAIDDVKILATAEVKKRDAEIRRAAAMLSLPLGFVSREAINSMDVRCSKARIVGLKSVAEACALFYSKRRELVVGKRIYGGVTVAIAR